MSKNFIINQDKLDQIRDTYSKLPYDSTEEDVKIQVVIEMLELLGYSKKIMKFEYNTLGTRTDIYINSNNCSMYVEIKKKNYELKEKDFKQLSDYLASSNYTWGLLTNGNDYWLMNNKVDLKSPDRFILNYKLIYYSKDNDKYSNSKSVNNKLLKYFSLYNIFIKCSTNYFSYVKIFFDKNDFPNTSLRQYKSSIFSFINYLNDKYDICDNSLLRSRNLQEYLDSLSEKELKYDSLLNKGRYITSFLKLLEDLRILETKDFNNYNVQQYLNKPDDIIKDIEPIKNDEISMLLNYYSTLDNFSNLRNTLFLKLFIYLCPSVDTIKNIKVNDICVKNNKTTILINNFEYILPNNILRDFNVYIEYRESKKIKCPYLFYTFYNSKYQKMSNGTINMIINVAFSKIDTISNERKKELTIRNIQKSIIVQMINNNFSLEELYLLTGNSVSSLFRYLDESAFKTRVSSLNKKLLTNKHPYIDAL